jgi:hypothetical protein
MVATVGFAIQGRTSRASRFHLVPAEGGVPSATAGSLGLTRQSLEVEAIEQDVQLFLFEH